MDQAREAAFRTWVMASRHRLRRTDFLLSGDWHLADDLVQEALTRVYAVWPRVSRRGEPDAYARKVLLNLYLDHRRRPARREVMGEAAPDAALTDQGVDGLGEREQLMSALGQVPSGQRAVLVLRFWEDLSIEQTAAVLDRSVGNVKSQASRGLAALRSALAMEETQ